ncbi:hypothetical protein [Macrococcoides canis]|uniref:hypothetical protein n=1 Tax=Macrococcoides canis TaxID=1855823 RepID=UPI001B8B22C7|nr:hypothetical protein [Macrococcus canis]QUR94343.1 hypothetical protein GOY09_04960 [Macrococcus canis]
MKNKYMALPLSALLLSGILAGCNNEKTQTPESKTKTETVKKDKTEEQLDMLYNSEKIQAFKDALVKNGLLTKEKENKYNDMYLGEIITIDEIKPTIDINERLIKNIEDPEQKQKVLYSAFTSLNERERDMYSFMSQETYNEAKNLIGQEVYAQYEIKTDLDGNDYVEHNQINIIKPASMAETEKAKRQQEIDAHEKTLAEAKSELKTKGEAAANYISAQLGDTVTYEQPESYELIGLQTEKDSKIKDIIEKLDVKLTKAIAKEVNPQKK